MNTTNGVLWAWGSIAVVTSALTGTLPGLLLLGGLAFGTYKLAQSSARNRVSDMVENQADLTYRMDGEIKTTVNKAREQYEMLKRIIGNNPTPEQVDLLQRAFDTVQRLEHDPQLKKFEAITKNGSIPTDINGLLRKIDGGSELLAFATLLCPVVPLLVLLADRR